MGAAPKSRAKPTQRSVDRNHAPPGNTVTLGKAPSGKDSQDDYSLSLLEESVCAIDKPQRDSNAWILVEATIDSGSSVSGIPRSMIPKDMEVKPVLDGPISYTSASEHLCKVVGRVTPQCAFQSGQTGKVELKILDPLKKIVLSTAKLQKAGYRIVHDDISFLECKATGVKTKMYLRNGVYVIPLWIKGIEPIAPTGFSGPVTSTP